MRWQLLCKVCAIAALLSGSDIRPAHADLVDPNGDPVLPGLALQLWGGYEWDQVGASLDALAEYAQNGGPFPQDAMQFLQSVNLSGLGQIAALAGSSLGGADLNPQELAAAAQQMLTDMGLGGLGLLAEQAGLTMGGEPTDWMAVAEAAQQVLSDLGLGGLGELAELAGQSLGGQNVSWFDLQDSARQTLADMDLDWLGAGVDLFSQYVADYWTGLGWSLGGAGIDGGVCPTFIQPAPGTALVRSTSTVIDPALFARICIPPDDALVRSDVPIYGQAGGVAFSRYRVECAPDSFPRHWQRIEESTAQAPHWDVTALPALMEGDLDLHGNLATWNTGLKNWEHLPWHPASDTVDLAGRYVIRLTVEGRDGRLVHDSVRVEVGRAIAQCLPGIVRSPDQVVTLHFPEHALTAPFRVFSVGVMKHSMALPPDCVPLTRGYEIREPGEEFLELVRVSMNVPRPVPSGASVVILLGDGSDGGWIALDSRVEGDEVTALLTSMPEPRACLIAVMSEPVVQVVQTEDSAPQPVAPLHVSSSFVPSEVQTFEDGLGEWAEFPHRFGARLTLEKDAGPARSTVLKIQPKAAPGNCAARVCSTPFDVRDRDRLRFDYRADPGAQADFYFLAGGCWYRLGFLDAPEDTRHRDVNIVDLGRIRAIADGAWRSVECDLAALLRARTAECRIDEVQLANWNVAGYMALDFGVDRTDAAIWVDDFGFAKQEWEVVVPTNAVGLPLDLTEGRLAGDVFVSTGTGGCSIVPSQPVSSDRASDAGGITLAFDVTRPESYAGWFVDLPPTALDAQSGISFDFGSASAPGVLIGALFGTGREVKVPLRSYLAPVSDGARAVIPMAAFAPSSGDTSLIRISLCFENARGAGRGSMTVRSIDLVAADHPILVLEDFENPSTLPNPVGGGNEVFAAGAACARAEVEGGGAGYRSEHALRVSYGGSIGFDLGRSGFSYAGWSTSLGGLNVRSYAALQMAVRGLEGGEEFNLYLDDGFERRPICSNQLPKLTRDWQLVSLPLDRFDAQGVDLTHIEQLQLVFEWREKSGTVYVDQIAVRSPSEDVGHSVVKR